MTDPSELRRRHLRFGWYAVLGFSIIGAGLELMHGFKVGFYLDVGNETRRLMWRLAHAHGALLGLVNIAFATTLQHLSGSSPSRVQLASGCLLVAGLLLPSGFFLGGLFATAGDPGLGVLLVPMGAALLIAGAALTAHGLR